MQITSSSRARAEYCKPMGLHAFMFKMQITSSSRARAEYCKPMGLHAFMFKDWHCIWTRIGLVMHLQPSYIPQICVLFPASKIILWCWITLMYHQSFWIPYSFYSIIYILMSRTLMINLSVKCSIWINSLAIWLMNLITQFNICHHKEFYSFPSWFTCAWVE